MLHRAGSKHSPPQTGTARARAAPLGAGTDTPDRAPVLSLPESPEAREPPGVASSVTATMPVLSRGTVGLTSNTDHVRAGQGHSSPDPVNQLQSQERHPPGTSLASRSCLVLCESAASPVTGRGIALSRHSVPVAQSQHPGTGRVSPSQGRVGSVQLSPSSLQNNCRKEEPFPVSSSDHSLTKLCASFSHVRFSGTFIGNAESTSPPPAATSPPAGAAATLPAVPTIPVVPTIGGVPNTVAESVLNPNEVKPPASGTRKARVLYDYEAADSTELALLADEVGLPPLC